MKQEEKATWLQQRLQSRWQRVHGLFESSGCAHDEELVSFLWSSFWPIAAGSIRPIGDVRRLNNGIDGGAFEHQGPETWARATRYDR
ncbi:hypothetical protein ACIP86_23640 [Pseudomonas neuropathica]